MPNYITHGLVHKKEYKVNKQAVKILREKTDLKTGAHRRLSPVGCVKAMWRYATQKECKKAEGKLSERFDVAL